MNIEWSKVQRVLVVKLRSIGDTVLATPSLIALRRFLPHAQIDILLEDWVAPILKGHNAIDSVISVGTAAADRLLTARKIRSRRYDVAFNLHGGTTATFFTRLSGARHRIGYRDYQYSFVYNHLLSSASDFWKQSVTHSAEQQLALLGFVGVPVADRPKSRLDVSHESRIAAESKLVRSGIRRDDPIALIHPSTAFFTKQWPVENYARTAEFLNETGLLPVAIASKSESETLGQLAALSKVPVRTFDDLSLAELAAMASKSRVFIGNDSGIAHIAAAVQTPSVVVFGSSNRDHWRPWTDAPNEIVYREFGCQPCPGYVCKEFGEPRCVQSVGVSQVREAVESVLAKIDTPS